jgi:hypothetical protein
MTGRCSTPEQQSIERRSFLKAGGVGLAVLASGGLLRTPFGSAVAAFARQAPSVSSNVDVQIFQTAASLENLAVTAYETALALPSVGQHPVVRQFVEATILQHANHGSEFNAHAEALGGLRQDAVNPRYSEVVAAMPTTADATAVIQVAATLEAVMTDTYLANLALMRDPSTRALMASVMCVETQHLAVLRTVGALLSADVPELIAIPTDLSRLPAEALNVACPQPFESTDLASPPAEGAVR